MKSVEDWAEIRRLHLAERMPIKVIARELAAPLHRRHRTVEFTEVPGHHRRRVARRLDGRWSATTTPLTGARRQDGPPATPLAPALHARLPHRAGGERFAAFTEGRPAPGVVPHPQVR
jgi:hypothetical protein